MNRNCLSYWFPKLVAAGVPVPKTEIVHTSIDLIDLCDGKMPEGYTAFRDELKAACHRIGCGPWFLRTGQGSGKHNWENCCGLKNIDLIDHHIAALVEWSHLVDFFGLAHDVWCIREMLPTSPLTTLPRYGGMPLVAEVRCFVEGGKIVCSHPYWPERSILEGLNPEHPGPDEVPSGTVVDLAKWERQAAHREVDRQKARRLFEAASLHGVQAAELLALNVAAAFADDGAWSVDMLETKQGFFVTDMAEAGKSFHYDGCPNAHRKWA